MAYVYLIDMYKQIDRRLAEATSMFQKLDSDPIKRQFLKGRIEALSDFKTFLEENFVPKLPRRIRQSYYDKE